MRAARILVPAELTGRELSRRRVALGLLTLLPFWGPQRLMQHATDSVPVAAAVPVGLGYALALLALAAYLMARRAPRAAVAVPG